MESFCCPRCLRVSRSPADVANGYCGACHEVTRIEGLTVVLEPSAGEFECRRCDRMFAVPPSHRGPVQCQCGALMRERLVPVCCTRGPLSPEALEQVRAWGGSAVPREGGWTLREDGPEPAYTARDYYRLARDAVRGPEGPAERARVLLDRMRRTGRAAPASFEAGTGGTPLTTGVAGGWAYLGTSGGEMFWAQADLPEFSIAPQSYEELSRETLENLTATARGTFSEQEVRDFYQRAAGWPFPEEDLPPAPSLDGGTDATGLAAMNEYPWTDSASWSPAEIDRLLARNQTVMEGLIVNHSAPRSGEDAEYSWPDASTWSPGYPEL